MDLGGFFHQIIQMTDRADLRDCPSFGCEVAHDDEDGESVKIVRQETNARQHADACVLSCDSRCLDTAYKGIQDHPDRQQECRSNDVDPGSTSRQLTPKLAS